MWQPLDSQINSTEKEGKRLGGGQRAVGEAQDCIRFLLFLVFPICLDIENGEMLSWEQDWHLT
jgi:hypothetical protein